MSRVIVVTGANRGIGFATASKLAAEGHQLVLACRDEAKGADAAAKIAAAHPKAPMPFVVPFDLQQFEPMAQGAATVKKKFKHVDSIVHNAWQEVDLRLPLGEQAAVEVEVNYGGTVRAHREYGELLNPSTLHSARAVFVGSRRGTGHLLNTRALHGPLTNEALTESVLTGSLRRFVELASSADEESLARPGWPSDAFAVAKMGVGAFARAMGNNSRMIDAHAISSSCCPGNCRTESAAYHAGRPVDDGTAEAEAVTDDQGRKIPLVKLRSVDESADTPAWLASSDDPAALDANGKFFIDRKPLNWVGSPRKIGRTALVWQRIYCKRDMQRLGPMPTPTTASYKDRQLAPGKEPFRVEGIPAPLATLMKRNFSTDRLHKTEDKQGYMGMSPSISEKFPERPRY